MDGELSFLLYRWSVVSGLLDSPYKRTALASIEAAIDAEEKRYGVVSPLFKSSLAAA